MSPSSRPSLTWIFLLLFLCLPCAQSLGAADQPRTFSDKSFNGSFALLTDGRLQLSMADGSRVLLGPGALVEVLRVGKSTQPSLRKDKSGRTIFAADPQLVLIYTFRFVADGTALYMTDPLGMVTWFQFDGVTGKVRAIQPPSGRKIQVP